MRIPPLSFTLVAAMLIARGSTRGEGAVQQWAHTYDSPDQLDESQPVTAVDAAGNVIVAATSVSDQNRADFLTAKYAASDGALLWEVRYDGPAHLDDQPVAVCVDSAGNAVVMGFSRYVGGNFLYDIYTAKYAAATGALLWERRYHAPGNHSAIGRALALDSTGDVLVAGEVNGHIYAAKYAGADGALRWENQSINGPADVGGAEVVALDVDNNLLLTGTFHLQGEDEKELYAAKLAAADGAVLWGRRDRGPRYDDDTGVAALAVDAGGNAIIAGMLSGDGYYTAKRAAADGALLWERRYEGPEDGGDAVRAAGVDAAGNVFVTGNSWGGARQDDFYTAKYAAADGALLWERRYIGPEAGPFADRATGLVVDGQGNIVVTGNSVSDDAGNHAQEIYTAKYAGADGALLWEKHYSTPDRTAMTAESVQCIALTPAGGVAVAGVLHDGMRTDLVTLKYAPVETTTLPASAIGVTSATFHGTASPGGLATGAHFAWGTTPALGRGTPIQGIGSGTAAVAVSAVVSNLPAGAAIYFQIRTQSSEGVNYGATLSFSTQTFFQGWKLAHLGDANAPDTGDPDGDGLGTLAEYGLTLLPETPDRAPVATAFDYVEGTRLRMLLPRDPARQEVTLEVQATGELAGPWTTIAMSTLGAPFTGPGYFGGDAATLGVKTVEVRDTVNLSDAPRRFLRVRVRH